MNVLMRCLLIVGMATALTGCGGDPVPLPPEAGQQDVPPADANMPAVSPEMPDKGTSSIEPPTPEAPVAGQAAPAPEQPRPAAAQFAGQPPVNPPQPPSAPAAPPSASAPQPSAAPSIDLSAGVAVPQSLPTGTAMGISVDYTFSSGQPQPAQRYIWVIKPAIGDTVRQPVQLNKSGTLRAFFGQLRPRHAPFETHIEGPDGSRISNSLTLEQSR